MGVENENQDETGQEENAGELERRYEKRREEKRAESRKEEEGNFEEEQVESDRELDKLEFEQIKEHSLLNPVPLPTNQILGANEGEIDQTENTRRIKELSGKTVFPDISLKEYIEYYDNPTEHPFTASFSSETRPYSPTFSFEFPPRNDKGEMFSFFQRFLFLKDCDISSQHASLHESLVQDFTGDKPKFAEVSRKEISTARMVFYCCSKTHERNGDQSESNIFRFLITNYCTECQRDIPVYNYMFVFDLREQIHLLLLSLPTQVLNFLKKQQIRQRELSKQVFEESNAIHDVDTGLLNHIVRKNGFYDSCDISLLSIFNTDAVALERKSKFYKDVWGIWLAISSLPIGIRFSKENLILAGLYTNKDNVKLSTSTLDPILEQINIAYDPWEVEVGDEKLKVRMLNIGSVLDGVEIPRVFNVLGHSGYFPCCSCDFCGSFQHEVRKLYFYRKSSRYPTSARLTREYRRCLLNRLKTSLETMSIRGDSKLIDEIKSFFALSTTFSESLHVIYEGVVKTLLEQLKKYNSKMYEKLVELYKEVKYPRHTGSFFNTNIDTKMKGKDYKFFILSYGWKCILLAGYPRNIVELFKELASIVSELEEKEDKGLTIKRIIQLHNQTMRWTDTVSSIFGHSVITSKFHRFEHMIAECILIGKFWTHSTFTFESANMLITYGVRGVVQPLPSVVRAYRKQQFCDLVTNFVKGDSKTSEFVEENFPLFSKKAFPDSDRIPNDRNPCLLRKIIKEGVHVGYVEVENLGEHTLANYVIHFGNNVGKISEILDDEKEEAAVLVSTFQVFKNAASIKGESIYKLGKEKEEGVVVKENEIKSFYCLTKIDGAVWCFPLFS